jgi:hypothetical protein
MAPTFLVHLERTDDGPSWWAVSEEVPGFSAAADTLTELRTRIRAALSDLGIGEGSFSEVLVGQADAERHRVVVAV